MVYPIVIVHAMLTYVVLLCSFYLLIGLQLNCVNLQQWHETSMTQRPKLCCSCDSVVKNIHNVNSSFCSDCSVLLLILRKYSRVLSNLIIIMLKLMINCGYHTMKDNFFTNCGSLNDSYTLVAVMFVFFTFSHTYTRNQMNQ